MLRSIFIVCLAFTSNLFAQEKFRVTTTPHVNPSLRFTENLGQWDQKIIFRAQLDGGALFMEKDALVFNFYDKEKYRAIHHGAQARGKYNDDLIRCHAYRINFKNCLPATIQSAEQGSDYENYFVGNDPSRWKGDVKNYQRLWYRNLYNKIDYEIVAGISGLKYNFHAKPGAQVSDIQLSYDGLSDLHLLNGALVYALSMNSVVEKKPYAYQLINGVETEVKCNYVLKNTVLSFEFPNGYDAQLDLVIDPQLVFAAQSGSTADNFGMTATWDANGNFYSGGTAFASGYPTTIGAYSMSFVGTPTLALTDVVITKYNSTGTSLLFSTYFGGSNTEIVTSMIVDHANNLCMLGTTGSTNFPVTSGAFDNSFNGGTNLSFVYNGTAFSNGTDIYIAKFNASGSALLASTFLGGSGNDGVNHVNTLSPVPLVPSLNEYLQDSLQFNYGDQYRGEIQVDAIGNIYIASSTRSSNFPLSTNAADNSLGGSQDAVLAKFNSGLSQLLYSTYLGGNYNDCGNALVVTATQDVYVTGGTCSSNFPTTNGAYATLYGGGKADGYISRFNTISGTLMQSTFIGTSAYDQSYFIQTSDNGDVYVFGQSLGNMPVINASYSCPNTHQFISRLNYNLSNLTMNTVIGNKTNAVDISPSAFSVDACENIYLSGWGGDLYASTNVLLSGMPLLSATQSTTDGHDFYLMSLSANAVSLMYGSYFGGGLSNEHVDGGTSRIDKRGVFYQSVCGGCGGNDDFPVTPGAWPNTPGNPNHGTNCNNGLFKIDMQLPLVASNINVVQSGCLPVTATLTNVTPGTSYIWYLTNGVSTSTTTAPVLTFSATGNYTVSLVVYSSSSCNGSDSSSVVINVSSQIPTLTLTSSNPYICPGESATLNVSGASSYNWNNGAVTPTLVITPASTTIYSVTGTTSNNCTSTAVFTQSVAICEGITENTHPMDDFRVYPNPTSGKFYIEKMSVGMLHLEVYDATGRLILKKTQEDKRQVIDLSDQSSGIYFLKLNTTEATKTLKLVVQLIEN